ncbi:putative lipase [Klebsiella variicola]|nr:putative lipase [Klebsiella variicola]SAU29832.1 putative lipase [Klebsiella variicola]
MIIKKCNGLRGFLFPASVSVWMTCVSGANAWQQEYIAIDTKSNTPERYTWDSDHQPRYEDILAERMKSSETPGGLALNQALAPPDSSRGQSVGWNYLLANGMTSGPVASLRSDEKRCRDGVCQHARLAHGLSVAVGRASLGSGEL